MLKKALTQLSLLCLFLNFSHGMDRSDRNGDQPDQHRGHRQQQDHQDRREHDQRRNEIRDLMRMLADLISREISSKATHDYAPPPHARRGRLIIRHTLLPEFLRQRQGGVHIPAPPIPITMPRMPGVGIIRAYMIPMTIPVPPIPPQARREVPISVHPERHMHAPATAPVRSSAPVEESAREEMPHASHVSNPSEGEEPENESVQSTHGSFSEDNGENSNMSGEDGDNEEESPQR